MNLESELQRTVKFNAQDDIDEVDRAHLLLSLVSDFSEKIQSEFDDLSDQDKAQSLAGLAHLKKASKLLRFVSWKQ